MINLLPLPALDGGRLLFIFIELIRGGRRIAPEKEGMVHFAGMVVLLALMAIITFFDVSRLFQGVRLLP
jgi:regulator of sigma E protease